ncbi:hypothetical protein LYNGBM3L_71220 [Moorena producens 3L]|uniref:SseB protein N-terminal domain-containing protein n=2 Tax=Coleofasciculaceae TaxID=1892251 RepID=F4Y3J9_9CYAN|nr:hypothetical protein LYNGBM3L_71220 [Moorena producens 3L]
MCSQIPHPIAPMELDEQINNLIDNAPQDGTTPQSIEAIAPVLKLLAEQLNHLEYYILQNLDQGWVLTTLSNRANPDLEKNVIYAFPTVQDAANFHSDWDPQLMACGVPVTHILFQMLAIDTVTSTVFFDTPGNLAVGSEVSREDLRNLIQAQLQQIRSAPKSDSNNQPPDIA